MLTRDLTWKIAVTVFLLGAVVALLTGVLMPEPEREPVLVTGGWQPDGHPYRVLEPGHMLIGQSIVPPPHWLDVELPATALEFRPPPSNWRAR